ncbi:MAG: hypothetical protein NXH86_08885 [Flavobacteriaceae bacterium]|nr:hypothetical protein [Flavobacteriaceae bacterium]
MEKIKEFIATNLVFEYRPYPSKLTITSKLAFWYSDFEKSFSLNNTPFREESLQDILDIHINENSKEISFHIIDDPSRYMSEDGTYIAWDDHKSNRYFVKEESIYECNRIAYQFITSINNKTKTIKLNKKDATKVNMIFDKGKIIELDFISEYQSGNKSSITITKEDNGFILIEYEPFKRIKLKSFHIKDKKLYYSHKGGEFSYFLDVSEDIYNIMEELLNAERVLGIEFN